jgi:hypothetical protein
LVEIEEVGGLDVFPSTGAERFAPASARASRSARMAMTSATARLFSFASTAESVASDIELPALGKSGLL